VVAGRQVSAAYVLAQLAGGDGFLAAFFAGLAVNVFDVTLCDCFLDYGEVTAEMAMLLTFLLCRGSALQPCGTRTDPLATSVRIR
jgi:hypothetical protein